MRFSRTDRRGFLKLASAGAVATTVPPLTRVKTGAAHASTQASDKGIIFADPQDLHTNIPLSDVLEISQHLNAPENRADVQFPNDRTKYAWLNMSKYYPTAQVRRSGAVSELGYDVDPAIEDISYNNVDGETLTVNEHFETQPIDGLVVVQGGNVLYERYRTMGEHDKHIWFSISKITGSTMLAFLEQEGKVDVTRPVSDYLEELKGSVWDTVALIEAVDMASGLNGTEHDEPNHDSRTNPDQIWYRWGATQDIGVLGDVRGRNESWVDVLRSMERVKPAYQAFEYNSINTFVMNRVVERVADKPLYEQMSERLWSKLGMEHDTYYLVSPTGLTLGFMGVNSTLRDLARFGMAFTPSCEKLAGERLIPQAILDKIQDHTHADMYDKASLGQKWNARFKGDSGIANRYQWDAVWPDGDFYKSGVGGQGLYVSPGRDLVIGFFCTSDGTNEEDAMSRAIAKSLA